MKQETYIQAKQEYTNSKITMRKVCTKYGIDRHTFSNKLKQEGISTRKKIDIDDTIFEKIDSEEKAYWLGFLYADGCNCYYPHVTQYSVQLQLGKKDHKHLEKYKKFLKGKRSIKFKKSTQSYRFDIYSKKVCEDLISLGCIPNKSLILKFPDNNQVPKKFINHFIRGYFDGDGSIYYKDKKTPNVSLLGTREFLIDILNHFNMPTTRLKKDPRHKNNTYYIHFRVGEQLKFFYYIYKDSSVFMDRKYEKYQKILNKKVRKKYSVLNQ